MQKKMSHNDDTKTEKEIDQISTNSADNSEQEDSGNDSDKSEILDNENSERILVKKEKKEVEEENTAPLQFGKKIKNLL